MSEPSLYILDMYCGPTDERKKRRSYVKDFVKQPETMYQYSTCIAPGAHEGGPHELLQPRSQASAREGLVHTVCTCAGFSQHSRNSVSRSDLSTLLYVTLVYSRIIFRFRDGTSEFQAVSVNAREPARASGAHISHAVHSSNQKRISNQRAHTHTRYGWITSSSE